MDLLQLWGFFSLFFGSHLSSLLPAALTTLPERKKIVKIHGVDFKFDGCSSLIIRCIPNGELNPKRIGTNQMSRRTVTVTAESINPEIRKPKRKFVDSVVVTELSKPLTAYCRCWRSKTFPLCDGSHVKHNKAPGDNVGPLLLKKQ